MVCRLILARHAQSTLDAARRYSGERDPDLTEIGHREANALAFSLKLDSSIAIDRIFSSGLKAARQTAEVIMRRFVCRRGLETVEILDERNYGDLTGLTEEEAVKRFGQDEVERRAHGGFLKEEPLAKSMVSFFATRLVPLLKSGETLLVVSYDDNLRALSAHIEGNKLERKPWRTGMAMDYIFDNAMVLKSKDSMRVTPFA